MKFATLQVGGRAIGITFSDKGPMEGDSPRVQSAEFEIGGAAFIVTIVEKRQALAPGARPGGRPSIGVTVNSRADIESWGPVSTWSKEQKSAWKRFLMLEARAGGRPSNDRPSSGGGGGSSSPPSGSSQPSGEDVGEVIDTVVDVGGDALDYLEDQDLLPW